MSCLPVICQYTAADLKVSVSANNRYFCGHTVLVCLCEDSRSGWLTVNDMVFYDWQYQVQIVWVLWGLASEQTQFMRLASVKSSLGQSYSFKVHRSSCPDGSISWWQFHSTREFLTLYALALAFLFSISRSLSVFASSPRASMKMFLPLCPFYSVCVCLFGLICGTAYPSICLC